MNFSSATSLAAVGLLLCPVITYGQAGTPIWTNRYNGSGNGADTATAIAVSGNGNVYVTGYSSDINGYSEYATVAYSSTGAPLWTNRYSGEPEDKDDDATAIAVDRNSNVYVTGFRTDSNNVSEYATVTYSRTGASLWTNYYHGPYHGQAAGSDRATSITVDNSSGNIFVTGMSYTTNYRYTDYATIAYSSTGMPLWTNRYSGVSNGESGATGIATDNRGHIYVTGYSYDQYGKTYCATMAYSNAGVPLWTNQYLCDYAFGDESPVITVGSSGNIYVANTYFDAEYVTLAYSSTGAVLWTNAYAENESSDQNARLLAIAGDPGGNVCVTGYSDLNENPRYATIEYSSMGTPLWTNVYSGSGNYSAAKAIAVDSSSNVYVTGFSFSGSSYSSANYATIAYSSAGVPLWTNLYNGLANDEDTPSAIAVDGSGSVYVTGSSDSGSSDFDYATIKYAGSSVGPVLSPIPLNIHLISSRIVLNWTNAAFSLQSAPKVEGVYTNVPGAVSPYTNDTSKPQRFFRLIEN